MRGLGWEMEKRERPNFPAEQGRGGRSGFSRAGDARPAAPGVAFQKLGVLSWRNPPWGLSIPKDLGMDPKTHPQTPGTNLAKHPKTLGTIPRCVPTC